MAGELWRSTFQFGKEVTPGTSVAATRKMYFRREGSMLSTPREARVHRFMTASRSTARKVTRGPKAPGGGLVLPLSSSEIIELLLLGVQGGVTPTTPAMATNTRLWTFKPSTADLDSATIEWRDGPRDWEGAGYRVNTLTMAGSVGGEITVTADLFGVNLVAAAITGALSDRVPDFIEGWQSKLYVDAFGGAAGTTVVAGTLMNWTVTINNNLDRSYTADNTLAANEVHSGEIDVTAQMTFKASAAAALTAFNDLEAGTEKLVRLEHQDETGFIETTFRRFVTVDLPGQWTAIDLSQSEGPIRTYQLDYQAYYDPTNAYDVQIRAQNNRTSAY